MIAVGVDAHKHEHAICALDALGQVIGERTISANRGGYAELASWIRRLPEPAVVGIEGAGSYGAGLCEHLLAAGIEVVEVERPKRAERRRGGKSDRIDALLAAKKVLANDGLSTPRRGGTRQTLSALLVAYRSCIAERTRVLNTLHALHTSGPAALREQLGNGSGKQLATRVLKLRRRHGSLTTEQISLELLRDYADRAADLTHRADTYKAKLDELVRSLDPELLNEPGIGPISAAKLLVCDPHRLSGEAAFARCNGTAPLPASSGQTIRHRLSRGGDRQANSAIHTIALSRSIHDPENPRLPQPPHRRRQNPPRSHALPQTTPLPQPLQTPHYHQLDFIEASLRK
jgi:transposase